MASRDENADGRDLVPVHGGLGQLVDRRVPISQRSALLGEADALPAFCASRADVSTVHRIADGALSPLEGPMGEEAWNRALDEKVDQGSSLDGRRTKPGVGAQRQ